MAGFSNDVVFGTNINLSGAETASMILDGQLLIGNTGGNPQVNTITSPGVSLIIINGSGTIGVDIKPPVSVANGGTGLTSITENAVVTGDGTDPIQISTMLISDAGEMTNPSQPAFLANLSTTQDNVTGDGATHTVIFATEHFDQGGDFDGTSTFTAPVAGNYVFYTAVQLNGVTADTDIVQVNINARLNRVTQTANGNNNRAGASDTIILNGAFFVDMDATDTCVITVFANGAASDSLDMVNTTSNFFGGYLEC